MNKQLSGILIKVFSVILAVSTVFTYAERGETSYSFLKLNKEMIEEVLDGYNLRADETILLVLGLAVLLFIILIVVYAFKNNTKPIIAFSVVTIICAYLYSTGLSVSIAISIGRISLIAIPAVLIGLCIWDKSVNKSANAEE